MNRSLTAVGLNLLLAFLLVFGSSCQPDDRAVFTAAEKGDLDRVKSIVGKRPELKDARDDQGRSPLYLAAMKGRLETVRFLADSGAGIEDQDSYGFSPLQIAAIGCHTDTVKFLRERGADLKQRNSNGGITALWGAAAKGCLDTLRFLIDQGADVNEANDDGQTPLQLAAYAGNAEVAAILIEQGADLDAADHKEGWTALHQASRMGHVEVVKLLLDRGARVDSTDRHAGYSPLQLAAKNGEVATVKVLLDGGADPCLENYRWISPVESASLVRDDKPDLYLSMVKLFPLCPEPTGGLREGDTVRLHGKSDVSEFSISLENLKFKSLVEAILVDDNPKISALLEEAPILVKLRNHHGLTALHLAIIRGNREACRLIIEHGADPNLEVSSGQYQGLTPLMLAEKWDETEIAELIKSKTIPPGEATP